MERLPVDRVKQSRSVEHLARGRDLSNAVLDQDRNPARKIQRLILFVRDNQYCGAEMAAEQVQLFTYFPAEAMNRFVAASRG